MNQWLLEAESPEGTRVRLIPDIKYEYDDGVKLMLTKATGEVVGVRLANGRWHIGVKLDHDGKKIGFHPSELEVI
jgi:hypothetical protein